MSQIPPIVRHMLLCDDVQRHPANPRKVNVYGLIHSLRSTAEASFPLSCTFSIYLAVTGGRGTGEYRIAITRADTEEVTCLNRDN
jgi:hypothetical protein